MKQLLSFYIIYLALSAVVFAADRPSENQIKAAMLYQLAKFISLPEMPNILQICFVEAEALLQEMQISWSGEYILSRNISHTWFLGGVEECDMVYLGDLEHKQMLAYLEHLEDTPVVTLSSQERFIDLGGQIGFVIAEGEIRLELNLTRINTVGVAIDSSVKQVAKRIIQ